jgi:hypothetical protein
MTTTNNTDILFLHVAPRSRPEDRDLAGEGNIFATYAKAEKAAESMNETCPLGGDEWVVCFGGRSGDLARSLFESAVETEQIERVRAAHAAATGSFDGPSWDVLKDLRVLDDDATDAHWDQTQEDGVTSYFAAGDEASDRYQRHRARLADAIADRDVETLRELADEEVGDIEAKAEEAEEAAREAINAAWRGAWDDAVKAARQAAAIERIYGDAPTWGPFEAAVKAAKSRIEAL